MTPYTAAYLSPLGPITLASDGEAVTGLWFVGQKYYPSHLDDECQNDSLGVFTQTKQWLDIYFSGRAPDFMPPLRAAGTAFQKEVWAILSAIPYGKTRTYGDIAGELAQKRGLPHMSAQAVGAAVGRNPISILIPCHRVVGQTGSLTGYAGGMDKKQALLRLEGALKAEYFIPRRG